MDTETKKMQYFKEEPVVVAVVKKAFTKVKEIAKGLDDGIIAIIAIASLFCCVGTIAGIYMCMMKPKKDKDTIYAQPVEFANQDYASGDMSMNQHQSIDFMEPGQQNVQMTQQATQGGNQTFSVNQDNLVGMKAK